ncbi:MAG: Mg chelatase, subunit ChlI, partial [Candidatus Moranbacteria bacterium GW2011_GWF1_35_5]
IGLDSEIVEVEVDTLSQGLHNFPIVGLPDTSIKESRDRVSSAIKNSGFKPPHQCGRITVNLAPADLPKNSPIYDIPIALGFLLATGQINFNFKDKIFIGELSLDGSARCGDRRNSYWYFT